MAQFNDIYMRDYPGDTGQIPSDLRQNICYSPDIIPYGANPNPNYQTDFVNNYNGPFNYYQNINPSGYNYIYVRGFNAFQGPQTGSIYLYYAKASLLLWPTVWAGNQIQNTNNTLAATIPTTPTNSVCVGQGAFYWQPPSISPQDHFCLVARVVTQQDPNVFPTTIADFAQWVANNANIAWRNVALVTQPSPNYSTFVTMANPVMQTNTFTLTVTCTGIPDGTVVSLVGSEPSPAVNSSFTVGPPNQTGSNPKVNQFGFTVFDIPPQFSEAIQLSANLGTIFPVGSSIRFEYYWLTQSSHPLAALGIEPAEYGIQDSEPGVADQGIMLPMGDFTFQF
jgi:hypothetical protein